MYYFFLAVFNSVMIATTIDVIFRYAYRTKDITFGLALRFAQQLAVFFVMAAGGFVQDSDTFGSTLVGLTFAAVMSSVLVAAYVWVWMDPDDGTMDLLGIKTVVREMLNHDLKGGRD